MPKMKSNRAAKKRFKRTGTGKIRRRKANKSHLLTHKQAKRKRRLRQGTLVDSSDGKRMGRMIGD
jgi:large subunit ribosomal protein L35